MSSVGPDAGRTRRQSAALARHLDEHHADTVLFLARHGAGCAEASAATVVAAEPTGLTLAVTTPAGVADVRLPFGPGAGPADVWAQVAALLRRTRSALPAVGQPPLTSLELQLAGSPGGSHRQG